MRGLCSPLPLLREPVGLSLRFYIPASKPPYIARTLNRSIHYLHAQKRHWFDSSLAFSRCKL